MKQILKKNSALDQLFLIFSIFFAFVLIGIIPFLKIFLGYANSGLIYLISSVTFKGLLNYAFAFNLIFTIFFLLAYFKSRGYYLALTLIVIACFFLNSAFYLFVIDWLPKNLYSSKMYFTVNVYIKPIIICSIIGLTMLLKNKFGQISK